MLYESSPVAIAIFAAFVLSVIAAEVRAVM